MSWVGLYRSSVLGRAVWGRGMVSVPGLGASRGFASTSAALAEAGAAKPVFHGPTGRYAHALYNIASKASKLEEVTKEVADFQEMRKRSPELNSFLLNPTIPRGIKVATLEAIVKKCGFSDVFANFLLVVAESGRATEAPGILQTFEDIRASEKGEITALVRSTVPLTPWQIGLLQQRLTLRFFPDQPDTDIQVTNEIDPELLGGLTITMQDKFIDMSWKKEIKRLHDILMEGV
eukprot:CAMPEP_0184678996 /NCGR_PEP_ID=MMETSP0312-20130426/1819_1 /TAXON_ID=31354 /ORGANISM="Compsopogon coeruleus, Strain SAG 36.94" /LENGTH=233 /DNA_ID=CAMNT_0027128157 /DNA_START=77 /DNA_END=778 /DNA_ORIENTATION=+